MQGKRHSSWPNHDCSSVASEAWRPMGYYVTRLTIKIYFASISQATGSRGYCVP